MWHPRVWWKLAAVIGITGITYLRLIAGARLGRSRRRRDEDAGAVGRWQARVFQACARRLIRVLAVRIQTCGRPPEAPFLLVSNHLGYLDVLVIASTMPCTFVSRGDVARWPVIGSLCRSVGIVFLDRKNKRDIPRAMEQVEAALEEGRGVVIFAEGTSTKGETVLAFRPSLFDTAARRRRPVCVAALAYRTPPSSPAAQLSVCWWGGMPFISHFLGL